MTARRTRWGGLAGGKLKPAGYFHAAEHDGVFWLVDPDGGRFLSKGVNSVRLDQDRIRTGERFPYAEACTHLYRNADEWRGAAAGRLAQWGFNTLGAWSDESVARAGNAPLAVTPILDLGMSHLWRDDTAPSVPIKQEFPDIFHSDFERHVCDRACELCQPRCREQNILGWFIDNELSWGPDWRGSSELLTLFLNLGVGCAGRSAARAWLHQRYPDFARFNAIWRTPAHSWDLFEQLAQVAPPYRRKPAYERKSDDEEAANRADFNRAAFAGDCDAFAALVAERYFAMTARAIKVVDTNHLVLGCRFAYLPPPGVVEAAARHNDIVSFNCYDRDPSPLIAAYATAGKPSLIGEFSFRAADSGLPNTDGAGPLVANQAERAEGFRRYAAAALRHPRVVGYHWFEHADQPAEGRFDGENSNFGIVTIDDRVYCELAEAMTSLNSSAEDIHAAAACAMA
ncbi:MAG TPA: agarase [Xanthobacteraceae bacterium]|nr:agarase [Xanthobacteraceae bacterium]